MKAHTPGPWHRNIPPASKYCTVFSGRNTHVAAVQSLGLTDAGCEANCDLIAAAPALLAALKSFGAIGLHLGADPLLAELCANARAAIAKATGGQA